MICVSLIVDMQPCLGRVIVSQIHENWGLDGPKIMKNRSLAKLWPGILRKLSPGEAQDRLRECQVGARVAQVGPCWR